LKQKTD